MTFETAFTLINTIVLGGWAGFGMICGLQWWQERKERAEDSRAFRKAVNQVSVNHLNTAKAQAYEQAVDTAYEHYLTEEQRDHLLTLNPHKENN